MLRRPLRVFTLVLASLGLACGFLGDTIGEKVSEKVSEEAAEAVVEKSIEAQGGGSADVELDQGKLEVKTGDGTVSLQQGTSLPADWPSDIPVYPGATIENAVNTTGPEGQGFLVGFKVGDGPDKVSAFYKEKLSASLASRADMNMNGERMMVFAAPDESRSVQVMIQGAEGGGSQVALTVLAKTSK